MNSIVSRSRFFRPTSRLRTPVVLSRVVGGVGVEVGVDVDQEGAVEGPGVATPAELQRAPSLLMLPTRPISRASADLVIDWMIPCTCAYRGFTKGSKRWHAKCAPSWYTQFDDVLDGGCKATSVGCFNFCGSNISQYARTTFGINWFWVEENLSSVWVSVLLFAVFHERLVFTLCFSCFWETAQHFPNIRLASFFAFCRLFSILTFKLNLHNLDFYVTFYKIACCLYIVG